MVTSIKTSLLAFLDLAKVVVLALAVVVPVRVFLISPFYVEGSSMEPTYLNHDYLLIDKLTYHFRGPIRGDVVVIHPPNAPEKYYIKRVVGLPGEQVVIQDGSVYVGLPGQELRKLSEPYLEPWVATQGDKAITLSADEYYVLGDNRGYSSDSRFFGPLDRSRIVGRSWVRVLPFSRVQVFAASPSLY